MTKLVAVLDEHGCLVGTREAADDVTDGVVKLPRNFDLPLDGTYKWDAPLGTFIPKGHALIKPTQPPIPQGHAVYLLMKALLTDSPLPVEVARYVDWYDENMRTVNEKRIADIKRRPGR